MNIVFGVLVGLLVLMILIVSHEFGHFIAARRNGVTVKEFGIGFPPRAAAWVKDAKTGKWTKIPRKNWDRPRKSLIFSINWLPIGGFCAMDGESDADTREGTFGAASFWQKTKILFAGVAMNWLVAFIILTVLAWTGMPRFIENQFFIEGDTQVDVAPTLVAMVLDGSPAAEAGLQEGDQILKVGETLVEDYYEITYFNNDHAGETVDYTIVRDGAEETVKIALNDKSADYLLGVTMAQDEQTHYRATWSAPVVGAATTVQLTGETFRGLGMMVWNLASGVAQQFSADEATREAGKTAIGAAGDSVTGPVGILGTIFPAFTETGPTNVAFLAALISVSLACMNVLPIPALDGGRWFLIALYRIRGKTLDKETEARIVSYAFLFLFALIILITVLDILRLF